MPCEIRLAVSRPHLRGHEVWQGHLGVQSQAEDVILVYALGNLTPPNGSSPQLVGVAPFCQHEIARLEAKSPYLTLGRRRLCKLDQV
jgi:hypothetical protein